MYPTNYHKLLSSLYIFKRICFCLFIYLVLFLPAFTVRHHRGDKKHAKKKRVAIKRMIIRHLNKVEKHEENIKEGAETDVELSCRRVGIPVKQKEHADPRGIIYWVSRSVCNYELKAT